MQTLITQVFRPQVVTEEFLFSYGTILVSNAEFFMFLIKLWLSLLFVGFGVRMK